MQETNFLKVVDTLEKFQERAIDIDSDAGRDFIVFKRQLYSLYEIQNRSIDEHEAFSFELQRQNLKWLYNASQEYTREMTRLNNIEDLINHKNLNGKIFKRKPMDPSRLKGLGYFGVAGMTWAYFPGIAATLGSTATMLGISGASVMGMMKFSEKNVINSIEFVTEDDEYTGMLKFNVSTSPLTSKDILVSQSNAQGMLSLANDDMGENDIDNNVIQLTNYQEGNNTVEEGYFTLPADSWKDMSMLDWVLSIKNSSETTDDLFNDLMMQSFSVNKEKGSGINQFMMMIMNPNMDRPSSDG